MAVAVDSNSGVTVDVVGATSADLATFTVGAGANRALCVILAYDRNTTTGTTVNWDSAGTNQPMAFIAGKDASDAATRVELWALIAPTSGNKNLHVAWTGSAEVTVMLVSFTGVDQTATATTFIHRVTAANTTANASQAVTSAAGNYTIAGECYANIIPTGLTQTQIANIAGTGALGDIGSIGAGAATVTHGYTHGAQPWGLVACDLAAVGTVGAFIASRRQVSQAVKRASSF